MRRWLTYVPVLLAGAAIGLASLALADYSLPPDLSRYEERSAVVLDADGNILRAFTTSDGMWRLASDVDHVDANYIDALIAYEDQRFYRHHGVDILAVLRASAQWARAGRIVSGASTLTMQTVRLLEPRPRTLGNKAIEMLRAVQLEHRYSKEEILGIYLTLAPFGGNLEGVRAASLAYFGKAPAELSVSQAALLVGLPQSPERLRPDRHGAAAEEARARVLQTLVRRGALSTQIAEEALEDPIPNARAALPFHAPRLARRLHRQHPELSRIRTYVDLELQTYIEALSLAHAATMDDGASLAIVVMENVGARVVAYSGGADFWAPEGQVDLARALRSPGSALKPFIYGMGFEDLALHPDTVIDDAASTFGAYAPQNFDREFLGEVTVRDALRQSLNVPAVMVLDGVGPMRLAARLRQSGARLEFGNLGAAPSLPLALGGVGISLSDLTMLYGGLAHNGQVRPLIFSETDNPNAPPRRLMGETASWYLEDILQGSPLPDGRAQGQGDIRDHAIAFKTGTSYGYRDAWAVGYSATHTVGIWVGRADGSPRPGSYGRNTAAPLLFDVFDQLPASNAPLRAPEGVLQVTHRDQLPLAMQRYVPPHAEAFSHEDIDAPRIAFPPAGAMMSGGDQALALRALGGEAPLRWMVNGSLLPASESFAPTLWQPDGPGFAEIAVIDALGRVDRARIQVGETATN